VTFNGNGATSGSMSPETAGTPTALNANDFVDPGYTFNEWTTAANGSGSSYGNGAYYPFNSSTTLYAQWTATGGGGGGGGGPAPATVSISAANVMVTAGSTVDATASVTDGLKSPDTATVTATYTFAGTGSTSYAASTTAPTAAGTYSITPSAAIVTISPATDAANYSTTYDYYPGTLTITSAVVVVVVLPPHATRVVGDAFVGESRTLTIVGRDFSTKPSVTSNEAGAMVRVHSRSATRIVLIVTVRAGSLPGSHLFTITSSAGKKCRIGYVTRKTSNL
jgi:hypothetical protein